MASAIAIDSFLSIACGLHMLERASCSCCASSCAQSSVGLDHGLSHDKNLERLEVGSGEGFLVI